MSKRELLAFISKRNVTMTADFVPFSQSRNKAEKHLSLNWVVTIAIEGREVWKGDYSAGCGHTAAYKASRAELGMSNSVIRVDAIRKECETGIAWNAKLSAPRLKVSPNICDVLYSLSLDGSAIDAGGFEQWASDFGYDTDSRKAEAAYKVCIETGLKLRNVLGENGLRELNNAIQDY